jgi:hypothetical protein
LTHNKQILNKPFNLTVMLDKLSAAERDSESSLIARIVLNQTILAANEQILNKPFNRTCHSEPVCPAQRNKRDSESSLIVRIILN